MNVVFISNYMNHHQLYLCDKLNELCCGKFVFVQTEEVDPQRIKLGWHSEFERGYIYKEKNNDEQSQKDIENFIDSADAIIIGACRNHVIYADLARKKNRIVIRYSERLIKKGLYQAFSLRRRKMMNNNKLGEKDYLLCASGYAAFDFSLFNQYKGKTFKWGYFPQFVDYPENLFLEKKSGSTVEVLWVGRFIKWKHPEDVLKALSKIKANNFHVTMIGTGELEEKIKNLSYRLGLQKKVTFTGPLSPEAVREYMLRANIFVMTSDYNEGWGAVLNEAMNCGCAVVVSHAVGAAPYLVQNGINALVYRSRNISMLAKSIQSLIFNEEKRNELGNNAFLTTKNEWNAGSAAENLFLLIKSIKSGQAHGFSTTAPCSDAPIIPQWKMYSKMMKNEKVKR